MKCATRQEWREWLAAEHDRRPDGMWLVYAKKGSGHQSVTRAEAVEEALCFGWIDSQAKSVDDEWSSQRFTPRRARSKWSRLMCEKAEELMASGAMQAKADGRGDAAYEPPSTAVVPDDLRAALDADPAAAEFFESLNSQNRYAILHRIHDAKRPDTRARRIAKFVAMCAAGEKLHP